MTDLNAFLPYVNGPLGFLFRRALSLPYLHRIVKISPDACHLHLGGNRYRAILHVEPRYGQAARENLDWFMRSLHALDMRLAPAVNFGFDTYSSQPDDTTGIDCYINSASPTTSFDTNVLAIGEQTGATATNRALIKFDFSTFTWPIFVSSATLSLWMYLNVATFDRDFKVYRQKRVWNETATWNVYSTGNSWGAAGGFDTSDCETSEIASRNITNAEAAGEKTWSLAVASVNPMIDGSWTNNGFMVKNDTETNDMHSFRASAYTTAGERPKLVMEYRNQDVSGMWL